MMQQKMPGILDEHLVEQSVSVPLCIDLDGTLIYTDLLAESVALLLAHKPWCLPALPFWLMQGRAALKRQLARRVTLTPSLLPYNPDVLEWIAAERAAGRHLVLATASDREPALAIAAYLHLFDEVLGSDGRENLKGAAKLAALRQRFGANFDYAGNSREDLAIWIECRQAVVVGATPALLKTVSREARVVRIFDRRPSVLRLCLRALRVHQWAKNLVIFVPLITSHQLNHWHSFQNACLSFLSFSLCASGVYVLNDLIDLESDRRHAVKRHRPFASGELTTLAGFILAPLLLGSGLLISGLLPPASLDVLLLYVGCTFAYSIWLKRLILIDVFTLAGLYTLRLFAGQAAYGVELSSWLLSFSMFLFMSLGFCKRTSELHNIRHQNLETAHGRGYRAGDLDQINLFGVASGFLSTLVLTLYMQGDNVRILYRKPELLWFLFPLSLYWISRIWMLAHRGEMSEDPVLFAIKDKVTWVIAFFGAVLLFLAASPWA